MAATTTVAKGQGLTASWKQYNSYSGPVITGLETIALPAGPRVGYHVDRAFWLTTMVETGGKLGAIMAADGTAMTAGLDQHIAVYPKELANEDFNAQDDQGSLWKLMARLETVRSSASYQQAVGNLWTKLKAAGWYISQDGVLRYVADTEFQFDSGHGARTMNRRAGDAVFGAHIRNTFTPVAGKVPNSGKLWEQSRDWALAFSAVTAHVGGEAAQIAFGIEHLVKRTKRRATNDGNSTVELAGYGTREITSITLGNNWPEELDLAMCMYQAHSVNAPAVANAVLQKARTKAGKPFTIKHEFRFAQHLIELLGNETYGRWDDDIEYGRYQRTRTAARASGLWSRSLFDGTNAIMPKDLAG